MVSFCLTIVRRIFSFCSYHSLIYNFYKTHNDTRERSYKGNSCSDWHTSLPAMESTCNKQKIEDFSRWGAVQKCIARGQKNPLNKCASGKRSGRPKVSSQQTDNSIRRMAKKSPQASSKKIKRRSVNELSEGDSLKQIWKQERQLRSHFSQMMWFYITHSPFSRG